MRIAIFGSRSLVAGALLACCKSAGIGTVLIGRGAQADLAFDLTAPGVQNPKLENVDALVVCSAAFGDTTVAGMCENLAVNVQGTLRLLQFSVENAIPHVLYLSSLSALKPSDSYGLTKSMTEDMLRQLCPVVGIKLTILRPAQLYDDAGEAIRHQPFFYFVAKRIRAGENVTLYGERDVERNYLHVSDLGAAILVCLQRPVLGIYNAVHPDVTTVRQIAETAKRAYGSSSVIAFDPAKPDMPDIVIPRNDNIFDTMPELAPRPLARGFRDLALASAQGGG